MILSWTNSSFHLHEFSTFAWAFSELLLEFCSNHIHYMIRYICYHLLATWNIGASTSNFSREYSQTTNKQTFHLWCFRKFRNSQRWEKLLNRNFTVATIVCICCCIHHFWPNAWESFSLVSGMNAQPAVPQANLIPEENDSMLLFFFTDSA